MANSDNLNWMWPGRGDVRKTAMNAIIRRVVAVASAAFDFGRCVRAGSGRQRCRRVRPGDGVRRTVEHVRRRSGTWRVGCGRAAAARGAVVAPDLDLPADPVRAGLFPGQLTAPGAVAVIPAKRLRRADPNR